MCITSKLLSTGASVPTCWWVTNIHESWRLSKSPKVYINLAILQLSGKKTDIPVCASQSITLASLHDTVHFLVSVKHDVYQSRSRVSSQVSSQRNVTRLESNHDSRLCFRHLPGYKCTSRQQRRSKYTKRGLNPPKSQSTWTLLLKKQLCFIRERFYVGQTGKIAPKSRPSPKRDM